jgi:hypothetical protein
MLALMPGAAANTGALLLDGVAGPVVASTGSAATVLATVVVAGRATAGAGRGRVARVGEVAAALPQALYGLMAGGLVVFVAAARALGGPAGPGPNAAATLLPLTASMGLAEWLLYRYRGRVHQAMQRTGSLSRFAAAATRALAGTLGWYLAALAGALLGAAVVSALAGGGAPSLTAVAGTTALGGALFLALTLLSCGLRTVAVAALAATLGAAALASAALGSRAAVAAPTIQAVTAAGLLAVLLTYAVLALSRATRHR